MWPDKKCVSVNRIILDAAYSLNDRVFVENLGTILLYAVIVSNYLHVYCYCLAQLL